MSETTNKCGARAGMNDVICELDDRHNSPHSARGGEVTWEPLYAADLRRAVQEKADALLTAVDLLDRPPGSWDMDDHANLAWLRKLSFGDQ